jgi:pimeloyl-ACP methyl ester carboxylesterase
MWLMAERTSVSAPVAGAESGFAARGAVLLSSGNDENGSRSTLHTVNGLQLVAESPGFVHYATTPLVRATRRDHRDDFDTQFRRRFNHSFGGIDGPGRTQVQLVYVSPPEDQVTTEQHIERIPGYHEGPVGFRLTAKSNVDAGFRFISYLYKPHYSIQTHAAIAAAIPELVGPTSAVGVSTGGEIMAMAAEMHPEGFENMHFVESGSIDGKQDPIALAVRTVGSGLTETVRAYATGDIHGGILLNEGLAWAANNIIRKPRSAWRLLNALANPVTNGLAVAKHMEDEHHIPSAMTIFKRDRAFRLGRMERAYADFVREHGDPLALPVRILPGGHYTLALSEETADNLTDTTRELGEIQRAREAQRLVVK